MLLLTVHPQNGSYKYTSIEKCDKNVRCRFIHNSQLPEGPSASKWFQLNHGASVCGVAPGRDTLILIWPREAVMWTWSVQEEGAYRRTWKPLYSTPHPLWSTSVGHDLEGTQGDFGSTQLKISSSHTLGTQGPFLLGSHISRCFLF